MNSSIILFLLGVLLLIDVAYLQQMGSDLESDQECFGKWIYIRKLPSQFNLDLLQNCSDYPLYEDFCPYLANHGLGHKTHNRSHSWYRTDPYMLELIFHRRILEYPCLTLNPFQANAIYLPYYAAIDSFRYLYGADYNSSSEHGLGLYEFLRGDNPEIWRRNSGHDHFLIMARPAWDFSQPLGNDPPLWGTSFLHLPEFYNVTALTLESRAWPWQEQAIPYPTSFHPPSIGLLENWIERVRRAHRNTFMLFAGGGGLGVSPNIRRSIRDECENTSSDSSRFVSTSFSEVCRIVDCSNGVCSHDPYRYMKPMLQASFCLQPPGETPTRRSTFDAILAGCIPVFFEELSAKVQFGWHLPEDQYDEFSVFIPKEEVVSKGLRILDVLLGIPKAEVRRKREKVIELMPRVVYRRHGGAMEWRGVKDAFDIAVDGTIDRIKSRISSRHRY
ncbi:putative xyloglucan galactosyltransferase gt19 [Ranunculus cassubicifolius]